MKMSNNGEYHSLSVTTCFLGKYLNVAPAEKESCFFPFWGVLSLHSGGLQLMQRRNKEKTYFLLNVFYDPDAGQVVTLIKPSQKCLS